MNTTEGNVLSAGIATTSYEGHNVRLRLDRLTNPNMVLITLNGEGNAVSARVEWRELLRSMSFIFGDSVDIEVVDGSG